MFQIIKSLFHGSKADPESLTEPKPPQSRGRTIIIGLDFGTSSTKILVRWRGDKKATIVQIDNPAEDYPWFASPSLVRLSKGKLFFGKCACIQSGGTLYRSLKVQLLPPVTGSRINRDFPDSTLYNHPLIAFLVYPAFVVLSSS